MAWELTHLQNNSNLLLAIQIFKPAQLQDMVTEEGEWNIQMEVVYKVQRSGSLGRTIEMGVKVMRHGRTRDMRKPAQAASGPLNTL